jgi:hypothetical protein
MDDFELALYKNRADMQSASHSQTLLGNAANTLGVCP